MEKGRGGNSHQSETNLNQRPLKRKPPRLFSPSPDFSLSWFPSSLEEWGLAGWQPSFEQQYHDRA